MTLLQYEYYILLFVYHKSPFQGSLSELKDRFTTAFIPTKPDHSFQFPRCGSLRSGEGAVLSQRSPTDVFSLTDPPKQRDGMTLLTESC